MLMKDGIPMPCPYQQPMMFQGEIAGSVVLKRLPCSDLCPLMTAVKKANGYTVLIHCGCDNKHINVEEDTEPKLLITR